MRADPSSGRAAPHPPRPHASQGRLARAIALGASHTARGAPQDVRATTHTVRAAPPAPLAAIHGASRSQGTPRASIGRSLRARSNTWLTMEPPPPPRPMAPAGGGQATAAADARPKKPKAPARTKQGALASLEGGYIGLPATDAPLPGFAPAGGGARKVLPEWVLPFPLGIRPCAAEGTPLALSLIHI